VAVIVIRWEINTLRIPINNLISNRSSFRLPDQCSLHIIRFSYRFIFTRNGLISRPPRGFGCCRRFRRLRCSHRRISLQNPQRSSKKCHPRQLYRCLPRERQHHHDCIPYVRCHLHALQTRPSRCRSDLQLGKLQRIPSDRQRCVHCRNSLLLQK
jgi:hypothetical protein